MGGPSAIVLGVLSSLLAVEPTPKIVAIAFNGVCQIGFLQKHQQLTVQCFDLTLFFKFYVFPKVILLQHLTSYFLVQSNLIKSWPVLPSLESSDLVCLISSLVCSDHLICSCLMLCRVAVVASVLRPLFDLRFAS